MNSPLPQTDWGQFAQRLGEPHPTLDQPSSTIDGREHTAHLLARRARLLASRRTDTRTANATGTLLITFKLQDRHCGIALNELSEVTPMRRCTPVPGAPSSVVGVVNRLGDLCSVIDLARLMQITDQTASDSGYILHLRRNDNQIGLRVDAVDNVISVNDDTLHNAHDEQTGLLNQYVCGLTPSGVNVIDITAVLSHDTFSQTQNHQGA